jgi:catechol 2,3-dioxygenase-like lactoylglutathione lyase family enzyme
MITGFNHTSFTVADLDVAVKFWTEAMGFEAATVAERHGDWQGPVTGVPGARIKVAHLFGHGHHMEFIQYLESEGRSVPLSPNMPCVAHVCLECSDIRETARLLRAHGATPQGEMVEVSEASMRPCKAGYLRDPNGVIIELLELPRSAE